ncbi:HD-GYP domain-containing protein [Pelotomaculum propionicicum]|uniref:HD-GYP domain-containing protein n=1 Tax=Pelotomaculum propionicicum TaxID=258475 RepID=UPI003B7F8E00
MSYLSQAMKRLEKLPLLEAHSYRVAKLAMDVAKSLRLPDPASVAAAAYMHDLGKTTWPPELFKKYALESKDWGIVKSHPILGEEMAYGIIPSRDVSNLVRGHHERPGGLGYPDKLQEPSVEMLVIAACNTFDHETNYREHRPEKMPVEFALMQIAEYAPAKVVAALSGVLLNNN